MCLSGKSIEFIYDDRETEKKFSEILPKYLLFLIHFNSLHL